MSESKIKPSIKYPLGYFILIIICNFLISIFNSYSQLTPPLSFWFPFHYHPKKEKKKKKIKLIKNIYYNTLQSLII